MIAGAWAPRLPGAKEAGRLALRAGAALAAVALAAACCRAVGGLLPRPLAAAVGLAVSLALPGLALLRASGLAARLGGAGCAALLPTAGLAVWAPMLAAALLLHAGFGWALGAVLAASGLLLAASPRRPAFAGVGGREAAALAAASAALAVLALRLEPRWLYDEPFHAARIRRLLDLPQLSLSGLSSYAGGAPHAGYAFPLLHAAEAGALRLAGLDAFGGYRDLAPACALFVVPAAYGLGRALLGCAGGAAATLLAASAAAAPAAWPHLGLLSRVEQPPAFSVLVLLPAVGLAAVELCRRPGDGRLEAALIVAVSVVALVHPSYSIFALALGAGVVLTTRRGGRALVAAALASVGVAALVWYLALHGGEPLPRAPAAGLERLDGHALALSGDIVLRGRAWLLLPLAALPLLVAGSRRRAALGGLLLGPLLLTSFPGLAGAAAAAIGGAQMQRAWLVVPWGLAMAELCRLAAGRLCRRRLALLALALAACAALPPALLPSGAWSSVLLGLLAAAAALVTLRRSQGGARPRSGERRAPLLPTLGLAAALVAGSWLGAGTWELRAVARGTPEARSALRPSPALLHGLRRLAAEGRFPVVLAPPPLAYRLLLMVDIDVVAVPGNHMRAEPRDHPAARLRDVRAYYDPATPAWRRAAILRRWRVDAVIEHGRLRTTGR